MCDKEADSQHHIKPRLDGGTDDSRNLVWLCKKCHDNVEGKEFTPQLIETERRRIKGAKDTADETYVFMCHSDRTIFLGIRVHDNLIPFNIVLPKTQALDNAQVILDFASEIPGRPQKAGTHYRATPAKKPGKPRPVITQYLANILDQDISIREKAKLAGLSHTTIQRYVKERRAEYVV